MIAFRQFLHALGRPLPYAWQESFAERCAAGTPPAVVAVPTGAGKTTVVEALVWALAAQADRPAAERTVGVRTVWAIDRRILVDEVHTRAQQLAARLAAARGDPADALHEPAVRLAALAGGDRPLVATRWRGGVAGVPERAGPLQPQVITSTVAQVGSRLLFRGYGVARGALPLEAGLVACDTTICLDEAHIAEPFRQTAAAVTALRAAAAAAPELPPLQTIALTATPSGDGDTDVVKLGTKDREQLAGRLTGAKVARLAEAGDRAGDRERVALLVERTLSHVDDGADSVACVVNTVTRARAVWNELSRSLSDGVDLALLVGPQRPVDRERILEAHRGKLFECATGGRRLVCVTTQTFEVGLDADVEAMVTESASMQALVQRLGRLNRSGRRSGRATIVRDPEPWLYGEHERRAWEWLAAGGGDAEIDVSVSALEAAMSRPDWPAPAGEDFAPELTAEVVARLADTAPRPGPMQEPDVEAFVNGVRGRPSTDVAVCWRADLRPQLTGPDGDLYRRLLLRSAPPRAREQLTLSVRAARGLIAARCSTARSRGAAARVALEDADVDVAPPLASLPEAPPDAERVPFVVVHRGEVIRGSLRARAPAGAIRPRDLEPGDVVVLPAQAGGCDEFGLDPAARDVAADVAADLCADDALAPVRLTPEALRGLLGTRALARRWPLIARRCAACDDEVTRSRSGERRRALTEQLARDLLAQELPEHPGLEHLVHALDANEIAVKLETVGHLDPERDEPVDPAEAGAPAEEHDRRDPASPGRPLDAAWVLVPTPARRRDELERSRGEQVEPPTLAEHAQAVHDRLVAELERLGLPAGVRGALLLAARAHDHGKADPRFQAFLHGGVRPLGAPLLAKSEFGTHDPVASRRAWRLAGVPELFRHEGASVAVLAEALASLPDAAEIDLDLAFVAVGTHHGWGRPLPPVPRMTAAAGPPATFAVEAAGVAGTARGDGIEAFQEGAWLRRLGAVNRRYGAWGAAYLVSLLVSVDHVVSAEGR